ncbi:ATP-dependent dethiobiotin synthetase BioD [Aeromonas sp. A-5]|uniref:ATP-dependent dethiobiotin synthetase BioD n=1 Tax=Aeromonas ichthyocola TaxID=3367746 RepID=UPI0038D9780D
MRPISPPARRASLSPCRGCRDGLRQIEQAGAELVVVEGAGGWFLPLDRKHLLSDWVKQENMPVIMVVGAKLGCLNHALLTFAAIRNDQGLPVAGWVINRLWFHEPLSGKSGHLEGLAAAPFLGEIPFINNPLEADLRGRLDISPLL